VNHLRRYLAAALLAALIIAAPSARSLAPVVTVAAATLTDITAQPPAGEAVTAKEAEQGREEKGDGWGGVIAKTVNFAIMVAVLVYFLKTPLTGYLTSRIARVRQDLVAAAETRETATRQLAEIEAKLRALPAELEALKKRGAEEIAAERGRIEQAAETERQRLLEHTHHEIDMRFRLAKRELLEHAADLAVGLASERIRRSITPDDQARLLDRYTAQLPVPSAAQRGGRA
jgi:F-type H+-transporting ATPase subunit b